MALHDILGEVTRLRSAGVPCCLATVVRVEAPTSAHPGDKAVIASDGTMTGWIGGSCSEATIRREALLAISEGTPRLVRIEPKDDGTNGSEETRAGEVVFATTCPSGGSLGIFLEPYLAQPQLVAIGNSPATRTVVRLASLVGFRTCAVHPGARAGNFPGADVVVPHLNLKESGIGPDSWVVVATMGHYDEEALEAVLGTEAAYVGLIASRRRRNAVVKVLRGHGWSGDALATIVNPAGKILGDSQEEIALSVLADIVDRRKRRERRATVEMPLEAQTEAPEFATDPVCGMAVEIAGVRYRSGDMYFCCRGCMEAYEASPEKYGAAVT